MIDLERTLGRPYKSMPVGKWMYVHHIVKKDTIDLFIVDKLGSRLYTINNTSEDRKKLEKTKQRTKQGIPQEGEFKKHNKISKGTELEHELVIRNLPVAKHIIKE